jgi:CheY-like chemotaxis protein
LQCIALEEDDGTSMEDERPVREGLAVLLRVDGYDVHGAASGPEALQFARGGLHPDVLIVDFKLGEDMNGAEVAEQIRGIPGYTPPVIMLTGSRSTVACDARRGFRSGTKGIGGSRPPLVRPNR